MDIKHLDYIISLAELKNLSAAAQKHSVTQSAVSQYLSRLEKEIGCPLFLRANSEWALTRAGELYVDMAKSIIRLEESTYSEISRLNGLQSGTLRIGFTPGRGPDMFISVYPDFHSRYPQITVYPHEMNVLKMQEELAKDSLDIGFMTLMRSQRSTGHYHHLADESFYVCVPADFQIPLNLGDNDYYPLETLKYEPFVLIYAQSTGRKSIDGILKNAGFYPDVLFETANYMTILAMIKAGICVSIIPEYYARQQPEGVRTFRIRNSPVSEIAACTTRSTGFTPPEEYFLKLASRYYSRIFR